MAVSSMDRRNYFVRIKLFPLEKFISRLFKHKSTVLTLKTKEKYYFHLCKTILSAVCWSAVPLDLYGSTSDNAEEYFKIANSFISISKGHHDNKAVKRG